MFGRTRHACHVGSVSRPVVHHAEDEGPVAGKQLVQYQERRDDELAHVVPYFSEIDLGRFVEPIRGITASSSVASRMLSHTRYVSTCAISSKNPST